VERALMTRRTGPSRSLFVRSGLAAVAAAGFVPAALGAQTQRHLRVIYFPAADVLPLWVGIAKGFFAQQGLTLALTPTPGSVYQFQHLSAGDFDIAITAIDNAIAYDEGQGQAELQKPAGFVAFLGGDNALLRLYARPEIRSYADLKGKTIAVDALTTGFAFVLRKMLAVNGLAEGDYTLAPAGGTLERYKQLTSTTTYAATLLTPPFDLQAAGQGFKNLGEAIGVLGHYQGIVSVASSAWLAGHPDAAVGYIRGILAALQWLYQPSNQGEAVGILAESLEIPLGIAARLFPVVVDRVGGLHPTGAVDLDGVRTVLALRSTYGKPQKTLNDPRKYYDEQYYRRALS
jgi:ABC-type nitrate/sulfonate/bicarbonate transport system substrate-binding protein